MLIINKKKGKNTMKKNLALVLALVMLMGTIFSVIPVAAAEDTAPASYEPEISYANINYSDKLYLMFAVPAPATDLGDSAEIELLVWANKGDSEAFSYNDVNKTVVSAEVEKATIGGAEYLVFKYAGLTAADMTSIIVARPVVINTTGDVTTVVKYGDIIEYSVLEYVATAKGEFGATALSEDVLAMLDAMLDFGGIAQKFSARSYDFFADDELSKIWYVPVINGAEGERVFGGFFKKGAELAVVSAPYFADYAFISFIDAEGNALYDIDGSVDNGTQMLVAGEGALPLDENGDLVIKASYGPHYMAKADPNNALFTSINQWENGSGQNYSAAQGGLGFAPGNLIGDVSYSALDLVDDPYAEGEKAYRVCGNTNYSVGLGLSINDWKSSFKMNGIPGFNDTIAPIATIDFTIARGPDGQVPTTGYLRIRNRDSNAMTNIGHLSIDGTFMLFDGEDGKTKISLPTKVAEKGWTRYVLVLDLASEVIYAYAGDVGGELVYQAQTSTPYRTGAHATAEKWTDYMCSDDVRIEWMGGGNRNNFTEAEKAGGLLADLDGDGVGETSMYKLNEDGTPVLDENGNKEINKNAVKYCFEKYTSMYIKSFCTYVGSPVEVLGNPSPETPENPENPPVTSPESFVMYDIDANSATATTKNSLIHTGNFGDETLKGDDAGKSFGGLGINTSAPATGDLLGYAGIDVIEDPYQTGNKVYSYNGNLGAVLWQADNIRNASIRPPYVESLKISTRAPGFFDGSIYPVITYDMTVGGNGYTRMLETDTIRLRGSSSTYVHLFKIAADGSILVCKPNEDYTNGVFVDTGADVRKDGYTRIVAEVDCANEVFKLYAADEGATLQLVATVESKLWITSTSLSHSVDGVEPKPKSFDTWMLMAKALDRTEIMMDNYGANDLTAEELATVETIDAAAAQSLYRAYRALLIKDWDSYLGYAK